MGQQLGSDVADLRLLITQQHYFVISLYPSISPSHLIADTSGFAYESHPFALSPICMVSGWAGGGLGTEGSCVPISG